MSINPSIFKAYDIRGTVPEQLNAEAAYQIGGALAHYLKPTAIAVGRDMRISSPELFEHLARGINDQGVDVIDLGLISTDALYFAVGKFGYDGGVMITASHNPKEYNGFKVCRKNAEPLSGQEGLNQVLKGIQDGVYEQHAATRGSIVRRDISQDYAEHCLSFIDLDKITPFHIVIDAGNGMAGKTTVPVLAKLPVQVEKLYFELDGTF
ncbi:MAG: phosphomannomutase/phosphoglucomutase, partial [Candidatus Zixiibacteriota bacterium]